MLSLGNWYLLLNQTEFRLTSGLYAGYYLNSLI